MRDVQTVRDSEDREQGKPLPFATLSWFLLLSFTRSLPFFVCFFVPLSLSPAASGPSRQPRRALRGFAVLFISRRSWTRVVIKELMEVNENLDYGGLGGLCPRLSAASVLKTKSRMDGGRCDRIFSVQKAKTPELSKAHSRLQQFCRQEGHVIGHGINIRDLTLIAESYCRSGTFEVIRIYTMRV